MDAPEVLGFRGAFVFGIASLLGGAFLAAGVSTALAFFFAAGGGVMGMAAVGNLPPFFRVRSSGWILGKTPPDAIVTPCSS